MTENKTCLCGNLISFHLTSLPQGKDLNSSIQNIVIAVRDLMDACKFRTGCPMTLDVPGHKLPTLAGIAIEVAILGHAVLSGFRQRKMWVSLSQTTISLHLSLLRVRAEPQQI